MSPASRRNGARRAHAAGALWPLMKAAISRIATSPCTPQSRKVGDSCSHPRRQHDRPAAHQIARQRPAAAARSSVPAIMRLPRIVARAAFDHDRAAPQPSPARSPTSPRTMTTPPRMPATSPASGPPSRSPAAPRDLDLAALHAGRRPTAAHCRGWSVVRPSSGVRPGCRRRRRPRSRRRSCPAPTRSSRSLPPSMRMRQRRPCARGKHRRPSCACRSSAARCLAISVAVFPASRCGTSGDRSSRCSGRARRVRTSGFTAAGPSDENGAARACRRSCRRRCAPRPASGRASMIAARPARMASATACDVRPSMTISSTDADVSGRARSSPRPSASGNRRRWSTRSRPCISSRPSSPSARCRRETA